MSQEIISSVQIILKGLLSNDNNVRNEASAKLEEMRKNTSLLLVCLINILHDSQDRQEKTMSAVLIRKILEIKDEDVNNPHWKALSNEDQAKVMSLTLDSLVKEKDALLKPKITECVIQIASNAFNVALDDQTVQVWPDVIKYAIQTVSVDVTQIDSGSPEVLLEIENGLRLFEGIYGFIYESLNNQVDSKKMNPELVNLINNIASIMKSKQLKIACRAVKSVSEMSFYANKKELKQFKDFILPMMTVTLNCFNQNKENELKTCMRSLMEMVTDESAFLFKAHFNDLFILMGKISEKKDFDDEHVRDLGFEVITSFIETKPSFISKDNDKINVLLESLFKYALGMEPEITEEWATPTTDSYFDEEFIYENEVSASISFIERIIDSLSSETVLPLVSNITARLIENTSDWRYKYIGILSFRNLITHVDDMVTVDSLFPVIFENLRNENAKIRYACLSTIEELGDTFKPHFQDKYSKELIPLLLNNSFEDKVLKVHLEVCECLNTIMSNTNEQVLAGMAEQILDKTFKVFLQENLPNNMRECLLNVVATLSSQLGELIKPVAPKIFKVIIDFFVNAYKNKVHKPIYGNLLECITLIGPYDEETYHKIIPDIVDCIITIQDNIKLGSDPLREYIQDVVERLVRVCVDKFPNLLPKIIESIMKLVRSIPEMGVGNNPENQYKIEDLLSSVNSDPNEVKIKPQTIKTSSTEEIASALETLNKVIETLDEKYAPYVEITNKEIFYYLNYRLNEDLRQIASDSIPLLLNIIKKSSDKQNLIKYAKIYTMELMKAIEKEIDNETLGYMLENFCELVEICDGFLVKEEINEFFGKVMSVFDSTEIRRISLLEKKNSLEGIIVNKKMNTKKQDDDDESDDEEERLEKDIAEEIESIEDIQSGITDLIGKIFATHKNDSQDVVNEILFKMIPKYFRNESSVFEKKMGMYLIDDICEYLGQEYIPANIWDEIPQALIKYSNHEECSLRQPALYGMGCYAQNSKSGFEKYAYDFITNIYSALNISKENKNAENWMLARDNAIASLGRIIKFQHTHVLPNDLPNLILKWLQGLPIEEDEHEMPEQHEFLCDIVLNDLTLIVGKQYENALDLVKTLARIYRSNKFSEQKIDDKIKTIRENILKNNSNFAGVLETLATSGDEKVAKKVKKLMSD